MRTLSKWKVRSEVPTLFGRVTELSSTSYFTRFPASLVVDGLQGMELVDTAAATLQPHLMAHSTCLRWCDAD